MDTPMPLLRVERLHKSFGAHVVLNGIDLHVAAGDVTCIVGPSGSGKSTLLRCLNFLEVPNSGVVFLDGEPVGLKWKNRNFAACRSTSSRANGKNGYGISEF